MGWIINKANDFWLSPANIDDNIIWPTQEAIEERTIVSNFVDNFIENIKLVRTTIHYLIQLTVSTYIHT